MKNQLFKRLKVLAVIITMATGLVQDVMIARAEESTLAMGNELTATSTISDTTQTVSTGNSSETEPTVISELTNTSEATDTQKANFLDIFNFEYEGQTLQYQVTKVATDTERGEVMITSNQNKAALSEELHIPEAVTYLGYEYDNTWISYLAFEECDKITSVVIPDKITSLGSYRNCISLTDITIGQGVQNLYSNFAGCINLKNINIPSSIKTIGNSTFYNCTSLENISIPDGVTSIGDSAFQNCSKLQGLTIPVSVISIGDDAFKGTKFILNVYKNSYAASYCKRKGYRCTYVEDESKTIIPLDDFIMKKPILYLHLSENPLVDIVYYPSNTTEKHEISWSSTNNKVATVNSDGMITPISAGKTIISAQIGKKLVTCTVVIYPNPPEKIKAVPESIDTTMINWDYVKGADMYTVYRSTSKSSGYKKIGYSNVPYYKDKNLNQNITYYYKITAGGSKYSKSVSAKPKMVKPNVNVLSVSNSKIKIYWDYIKGITEFKVYRAVSKNGAYKYVKTTVTNYFIDSTVTKGKSYYYRIQAYDKNSKVYSQISNTANGLAKTPATPKYVTLGTNKEDVYKILGKPSIAYCDEGSNYENLYLYYKKNFLDQFGTSIYLKRIADEYVVIGWENLYPWLKISDGNEKNTGSFTLGSTLEEVNKVMETPVTFEFKYTYSYRYILITGQHIEYRDGSTITYNKFGEVISWNNKGCLKAKLGAANPTHAAITLGSSLAEVTQALGTPDRITTSSSETPCYLYYGKTILTFDHSQRLAGWEDRGKLNITLGSSFSNPPEVGIGSSIIDVIRANGTPDTYKVDTGLSIYYVKYASKIFYFDYLSKVSSFY